MLESLIAYGAVVNASSSLVPHAALKVAEVLGNHDCVRIMRALQEQSTEAHGYISHYTRMTSSILYNVHIIVWRTTHLLDESWLLLYYH
jgi:hypothetical protein